MRRKIIFIVVGVVLAALLITAGGLYRATQQVPEFYREALTIEVPAEDNSGELLEEQVFAFSNQVKQPRTWSLRLTDRQINAWLAKDLPEKFPDLLPPEVDDPRVSIQQERLLAGCRYNGKSLHSILAISLTCFLVEGEQNVVGIQLHDVSAGALPIPVGQFIGEIEAYAQKVKIPLRWQQHDGDPVALLTIPSEGPEIEGEIRIDALQLKDGEIVLSGETLKTEEELSVDEGDTGETVKEPANLDPAEGSSDP